MELQQLKHFIAAVDTKKLLTAAEVCEISQSGMSRSLGTLEETLGVRLLKRTAGGVEPTMYGQFLLPGARSIVSQVERCSREMMALKAASGNALCFGVANNFCQLIVPLLLDVASAEFPEIAIEIRTGNLPKLMDDLHSGSIDCLFGLTGRVNDHPDIIFDQIVLHRSKVIARRDHPLTLGRRGVLPAELSRARWATLDGEDFEKDFTKFFSSKHLPLPSRIMKTDSISVILEALAVTDLVASLPPEFIGDGIRQQSLAPLNCEGPEISMNTSVAIRKTHFMLDQQIDLINRVKSLGALWLDIKNVAVQYGNTD